MSVETASIETITAKVAPGPRLPRWVQTVCYGVRPVSYLRWCHRRFGDVFTVQLPGDATVVVLASPDAIAEVCGLRADAFAAASAAPILEPFLGPRSLLLLDGERHRRERQLLVHSLPGSSMRESQAPMV